MRFLTCTLLFACAVTSCGSSDVTSAPADSPPSTGDSGAAPIDRDGGTDSPTDADGGSPKAEGGGDAVATDASTSSLSPQPPVGAKPCGSGTFTQQQATVECQSGATWFGSNGVVQPAPCGAVTMTAGRWEAYCTDDTTYVWAKFEGVAVTAGGGCGHWTLNPYFRTESNAGATGNNAKSGYAGAPSPSIKTTPSDLVVWVTTGADAWATLFLGAMPDPLVPGCNSMPSSAHLFLGVTGKPSN